MSKALKAIVDKIEKKYPRFKLEKGETSIAVDGEGMCPARQAVDEIDNILKKLEKFVNKEGTFRVVKVVGGCAAAQMVKIKEDYWLAEEDELMKLEFVVPPRAKNPQEEFGPKYVVILTNG